MTDLRQMSEWGKWMESIGWQTDVVKGTDGKSEFLVLIKKVPLLPFSILKLQRFNKKLDFDSLKSIKKKFKITYSVLEPMNLEVVSDLIAHGYKLSKGPYLPTKTLVLDLTKSEDSLFTELSTNAKRILKKENNIEIKKINEEQFYEGWKRWAKSLILTTNQFNKLNQVFGKKIEYWASFEGEEISSAIMMIYSKDGAHYYQTWTSESGRKNNGQFYLVWETMLDAKRRGKKYYDFEGIQDVRFPLRRWEGFTEFKKKFGGQEIEYPGCFSKWF